MIFSVVLKFFNVGGVIQKTEDGNQKINSATTNTPRIFSSFWVEPGRVSNFSCKGIEGRALLEPRPEHGKGFFDSVEKVLETVHALAPFRRTLNSK